MKTIVATLFVTLFAVSMPVHAQWEPHTAFEPLTGGIYQAVNYTYRDDNRVVLLVVPCNQQYNHFWIAVDGFYLNDEYDSGYHNILADFDGEHIFNLVVVKRRIWSMFRIMNHMSFFSKLKKHRELSIPIHHESDFIARIDLTRFNEIYDLHCGIQ